MGLAKKQNPVVGFWDPLGIVTDDTAPETIGWFRHAEIKHGRVAMAAFVGYCIHANGITFPWNIQAPLDFGPGWPFAKDLAPYAGEYMAPLTAADASLPFVSDMIGNIGNL